MDHTDLTGSCGPTLVLEVHGINKKSGFLVLKNRFSSWFSAFMVRPQDLIRFWKSNGVSFRFIDFSAFSFLFSQLIHLKHLTPSYSLFICIEVLLTHLLLNQLLGEPLSLSLSLSLSHKKILVDFLNRNIFNLLFVQVSNINYENF